MSLPRKRYKKFKFSYPQHSLEFSRKNLSMTQHSTLYYRCIQGFEPNDITKNVTLEVPENDKIR